MLCSLLVDCMDCSFICACKCCRIFFLLFCCFFSKIACFVVGTGGRPFWLFSNIIYIKIVQVKSSESFHLLQVFMGLHEDDEINSNQPSVSSNINQEFEVNLIISEYCMPGMTSYDLLKKVKVSHFCNHCC
ncbi:hypothetical protein L1987_05233 [Smallanthus sonchifolius]|uniref:Uncharacterized protein n=1 Tax=Smallanthus sonchifolius TaxID=185202 RepID=A0ACB9JUT3_9ASTR|nr:hypothetical protein L1987_05233 [Smallanthus sonchifolius]